MDIDNWDGKCPACGGTSFYNIIDNRYKCKDCGTKVIDINSDYNTLYMFINGEYQEVQVFFRFDERSTDFCNVMSKETFDKLDEIAGYEVCRDEIIDLDPLFYKREDIEEWYNEDE